MDYITSNCKLLTLHTDQTAFPASLVLYVGGKASGVSGINSLAAPYLSPMWPWGLLRLTLLTSLYMLYTLCFYCREDPIAALYMVANVKVEGTKSSVMLEIILMMAAGLKCQQCMVVTYHVLEFPEGKVGHPYVTDLVITSELLIGVVKLNQLTDWLIFKNSVTGYFLSISG